MDNKNGNDSLHSIRKKLSKTHELISVTFHEAGHAVYGLLHLMRVESVCIVDGPRVGGLTLYNSLGESALKEDSPNTLYDLYINEVAIKYAGLAAEKIHYKKISGSNKFPMILRDGSSDDTLSAAYLIRKHDLSPAGKKRYSFKKKLIREVSLELENHWDAVTVIAHALFDRKKIYFDDIKNILIKKTEDKEFWKNKFKDINYIYNNIGSIDKKYIIPIL